MTVEKINLMEAGIYSIPQASWLVGAPQRAVRVWVEGQHGRQRPIIENQIGRIGRKVAVSFTNLMELRFVHFFVSAGVSLKEIRSILDEVKRTIGHPHPFATKTIFKTDGRKIVAEIARRNGLSTIYDLRTGNYEMIDIVMESLKSGVAYEVGGDAIYWTPRPIKAPNIIVHPKHSFGKPILKKSHIPTDVIARAFEVEGDAATVSELYEVPEKQVCEAVAFERDLRLAA